MLTLEQPDLFDPTLVKRIVIRSKAERAARRRKTDAEACNDKANRNDATFSAKAQDAIVAHLRACEGFRANSEDLVDIARAKGAVPHDDRAFGQVFRQLAKRGLIHTVGYALRRKGKGAAGARIWALVVA